MTDAPHASRRQAALNFAIGGALFFAAVIAAVILSRPDPDPDRAQRPGYDVLYTVAFLPEQAVAEVTIALTPGDGSLRELRLTMPAGRYLDVGGDGRIVRAGDTVTWTPERDRTQQLRYRYRINQRRGGGYDALINRRWVIVRGDDLVPPTATTGTRGADARARLVIVLPPGWDAAETPYVRSRDGESFVIATPGRSFDRPLGWIVAGDIGIRRERVRGTRLSVAGPTGGDLRRMDTLAHLNLLLPEYRRAFGDLPLKLLVVLAGDPMWHGGLSGPRSLFLHADRPLISENGSSTLAHEMTHVLSRIRGGDGDDWIAEGLAEYYSIELSRRAGLITDDRAEAAFGWMQAHGGEIVSLVADRSSRARTARAVQLFVALDREIRAHGGESSLDDVVRLLMTGDPVTRADLRAAVVEVTGEESGVLATPLLD